jgi:uncharacterized protein YyaL (SSP411 family)
LDFFLTPTRRVVIVGSPTDAAAQQLVGAAHSVYQPNKVILGNAGAVEEFAKTLPVQPAPMAYVCTGTACQPPTNDPKKIRPLLVT